MLERVIAMAVVVTLIAVASAIVNADEAVPPQLHEEGEAPAKPVDGGSAFAVADDPPPRVARGKAWMSDERGRAAERGHDDRDGDDHEDDGRDGDDDGRDDEREKWREGKRKGRRGSD